jgi:hypothetical protein
MLQEEEDYDSFVGLLTTILDLDPDNEMRFRAAAYLLDQDHFDNSEIVAKLYKRLFEMRPEEPLSLRDYALNLHSLLDIKHFHS